MLIYFYDCFMHAKVGCQHACNTPAHIHSSAQRANHSWFVVSRWFIGPSVAAQVAEFIVSNFLQFCFYNKTITILKCAYVSLFLQRKVKKNLKLLLWFSSLTIVIVVVWCVWWVGMLKSDFLQSTTQKSHRKNMTF